MLTVQAELSAMNKTNDGKQRVAPVISQKPPQCNHAYKHTICTTYLVGLHELPQTQEAAPPPGVLVGSRSERSCGDISPPDSAAPGRPHRRVSGPGRCRTTPA